jgi:hypothetical protein
MAAVPKSTHIGAGKRYCTVDVGRADVALHSAEQQIDVRGCATRRSCFVGLATAICVEISPDSLMRTHVRAIIPLRVSSPFITKRPGR